MLKTILNLYWNIALKRKSPADIPNSQILLYLTILVYLCLTLVRLSVAHGEQSLPILFSMLFEGVVLMCSILFIYLVLVYYNFKNRLTQTLNAYLGTTCLFNILSLLGGIIIFSIDKNSSIYLPLVLISAVYLFIVAVWNFIIMVYIFQEALEINTSKGVMIVLALGLFKVILLFILMRQL